MYVDGQWQPASTGGWIESIDPSTGQAWSLIPRGTAPDAARAAEAAHRALAAWAGRPATQRGALLRKLAELVARDAEALAQCDVRDNGKPVSDLRRQYAYLAEHWHYFAGLADKIEGRVIPVDRGGVFNYTQREPIGVVAAIAPWNSPLVIASWKIAPALVAGCTVVVKPSEHASASTLAFCRLVEEAGFPPGVVNVVTGLGEEVVEALVRHPKVAKVSFTGGEVGGQKVYQAAASDFKPVTLELGGKSAQIVFADADLEFAAREVVNGIFNSSGQSCVAGSRLLVQASVHERFVARVVELTAQLKIGCPGDADTQMGPLSTQAQYERFLGYARTAAEEGARCAFGGGASALAQQGGWFVEPAVFTGVTAAMRIWREEIFGPLLAVMPFEHEEDAIRIANDTAFGLAAGCWTNDLSRALRVSSALQAGTVWVNAYRGVSSMTPMGGYKRSGFGRENGQEAIDEFLQTKSVWIGFKSGQGDR
jgi:aldehyde dehydrogenase (NAD+)